MNFYEIINNILFEKLNIYYFNCPICDDEINIKYFHNRIDDELRHYIYFNPNIIELSIDDRNNVISFFENKFKISFYKDNFSICSEQEFDYDFLENFELDTIKNFINKAKNNLIFL